MSELMPWRVLAWVLWIVSALPLIVVAAFLGWRYVVGLLGGIWMSAAAEVLTSAKAERSKGSE